MKWVDTARSLCCLLACTVVSTLGLPTLPFVPQELGLEPRNETIKARVDETKLLLKLLGWVCALCFSLELLVLLQSSLSKNLQLHEVQVNICGESVQN